VHFVVFTFGLAELVRQLFTWYESNVVKVVGRYIFTDITQKQIYLQLLLLFVLVVAAAFFIRHSRLGLALRLIGEDEAAARHLGVDTTRAKVLLFVISAGFMTLVGAVMAPRWTYVDPSIVFNPTISFQVVIMALLGGAHRLLGPIAGVIPLTALFEFLSARFPNHFSIMLGITFLAIVFIVPRGISEWLMQLRMPHLPRWGRKGIA
jgi:branched-chain amino acid transport system permease protein